MTHANAWGADDSPIMGFFDRREAAPNIETREIGIQLSCEEGCFIIQMHVLADASVRMLKDAVAAMFNLPLDSFCMLYGSEDLPLDEQVVACIPKCEGFLPTLKLHMRNDFQESE